MFYESIKKDNHSKIFKLTFTLVLVAGLTILFTNASLANSSLSRPSAISPGAELIVQESAVNYSEQTEILSQE